MSKNVSNLFLSQIQSGYFFTFCFMSKIKNLTGSAIAFKESYNESQETEKTTKTTHSTMHHHHKRKKRKKFVADFNIPGVYKIGLPDLTQQYIGCVVGDNVTVENSWRFVDKELVEDHIESYAEESQFYRLKDQIFELPRKEILLSYIPDESKEYNEFYVCVTEEATTAVQELLEKIKHIQEEKLKHAVNRRIKKWKSLGSEEEVENEQMKAHRSLLEIEIESKYPIFPSNFHFKCIKAEDLRFGYMALECPDESNLVIFKKRNHIGLQITPDCLEKEAQTICTYPLNNFSQYEYNLPDISWMDMEKPVTEFVLKNVASVCEALCVNSQIDLYRDDYIKLKSDHKYAQKEIYIQGSEYKCFVNMALCGGKMSSGVSWHPLWSGCVIISYVDINPGIYLSSRITTDEVFKAIHDTNPVLFWSFDDDLTPKLILETPRPVYVVSCCPYDPNIIIGGCVNGQIILWDITNKLNIVEAEEILTVEQQQYRDYMFSLMYWMKNIYDKTRVRPTALSDLKYSHSGCVTSIIWASPFHNITKSGQIQNIKENQPHSLQLFTSAEDGTVMIWDLLKKPVRTPGSYSGIRKVKRLLKRPSALLTMESPFKVLHLTLKPIYKINLTSPLNKKSVGMLSFHAEFFQPTFDPPENLKTASLLTRLEFTPDFRMDCSKTRQTFYVGTVEGDFMQCLWEGQKFDSGEIVNYEEASIVHYGKYHDGPIRHVDYAPETDTVLTVGGKIFALWRESFKNRPIFWRKSTCIYTDGCFFTFDKTTIKLCRMDGYKEVWMIAMNSKTPVNLNLLSNGPVTLVTTHDRKLKKKICGLCDYRGLLSLYVSDHTNAATHEIKQKGMVNFVASEIERKQAFAQWQQEWEKRHIVTVAPVEKEQSREIIYESVEPKVKEEKKKVLKISPGTRYLETMQEEQQKRTHANIKKLILQKKQINEKELIKRRYPLQKLEEEHEEKKRKQKCTLKESGKIFRQQVEMYFPDVVKEKPPPPPDPYTSSSNEDLQSINYNHYQELAQISTDFVAENPFKLEFSWRTVLREGSQRRKKIDDVGDKYDHMRRFQLEKASKVVEEPPPSPTISPSLASQSELSEVVY